MAKRIKIKSEHKIHFITFSVYKRIPIFKNGMVAFDFINNLKFYSNRKRFIAHAYVIMPTHIHLLIELHDGENLSNIMRDIKKYFSYRFKNILSEKLHFELENFYSEGRFRFWERSFDEVTIMSEKVFRIKLKYIINNPVKAGLVEKPEDYPYLYIGKFDEMRI